MALWNGGGTWNSGILWGPIPVPIYQNNKPKRSKTMKQEYFPTQQGEQPEWLDNFANRLEEFGPVIPLVAGVVTSGAADARFLSYCIGDWLTAVRDFGPGCTAAIEMLKSGTGSTPIVMPDFSAPDLPTGVAAVPPGALDRIFSLVQLIKKSPGYTADMGQLMGIIGPEASTEHLAPVIRLKVEMGSAGACQCVKISFTKYGHAGVAIYSRRGGGDWELLGTPITSPYMDSRPLLVPTTPEVREYRARFWDGGENGDWTDIASVTVAP